MSSLMYRRDMDAARARLTTWWNGGDIGRPAMQITAPREEPIEHVPAMPEPEGWLTRYSTSNFDYRVNLSARACVATHYLAEAVPCVAPDLAPNCLALYLGCRGVETEGTVWCEPCVGRPEDARFEFDPENAYWQFTLRLSREQMRLGHGKFLIQFPDLIEGLDTLAALRGSERLLVDLVERPAWVCRCLRQITDRYFHYYDILYDRFRDEVGGSIFWAWAPGRMAKFQCDFSAMISPAMFEDLMVPVLTEMCERVSYCMYHWDGPGALPHHDLLLAIPRLTMIQWTPGAGAEPTWHPRWWPLYHKTLEAEKKLLIGCDSVDTLHRLKSEFGEGLKQFLINMRAESPAHADEILRTAALRGPTSPSASQRPRRR
jgi:5-methyltetrahydrofolate--homocysteine methyltransferase